MADVTAVDLGERVSALADHWPPGTAAHLSGQDVRLVKTQGVFPWHSHASAEEMFLVFKGRFVVEFRDHIVEFGPGQMVVVPRGVEHRTASDEEAEVLIFEPSEGVNTGEGPISGFAAPRKGI
jgi:mannose-6-phosphate isomerase-like protein (cupin superfamily)